MIVINKGETNSVALTLTEKTTIVNPIYYLFRFVNVQKETEHTFIAPDLSDYKLRYNSFDIIETENPNPLIGEVELSLPGRYYYYIYAQHSATNLDPAQATQEKPVEQGFVIVRGESSTTATVYEAETIGHVYKPK